MEGIGGEGLERLYKSLVDAGAGKLAVELDSGLALPVDSPSHMVRLTLQGARELDWGFERAWASAIARLQPSQAGGEVDAFKAAELREDRRLLEEDKPYFRAAYERRDPTLMERAQYLARATDRLAAGDAAMRSPIAVAIPARPLAA